MNDKRIQRVRHELKPREVTVSDVKQLAPNFVSVTFKGESLHDFVSMSYDDHVKFILHDDDSIDSDLGVVCRSLHRPTGLVHVCPRLEEFKTLGTEPTIRHVSVCTPMFRERCTHPRRQLVNDEVADVVTSCGVLLAGVA